MTARFDSAPWSSPTKSALGVTFEDYHEQWNAPRATRVAASGLDLYRSRWNVAPQLTFAVARPLTVSVGASFEEMESETPGVGRPFGQRRHAGRALRT